MRVSPSIIWIPLGASFLSSSYAQIDLICASLESHRALGVVEADVGTTVLCPPLTASQQQTSVSYNQTTISIQTAELAQAMSTSCQPYPTALIMSLNSSLLSYQQYISELAISTFAFDQATTTTPIAAASDMSLPACPILDGVPLSMAGCTVTNIFTPVTLAPQTSSATVNVPTLTPTSGESAVTSQMVAIKRTLPRLPREEITTVSFTLQSSSTDANLHNEPEPTTPPTSSTLVPKSTFASPTFNTITPSSRKSTANMGKTSPMMSALICALFALLLATPALAISILSATTGCTADLINGCSSTAPSFSGLPTILAGVGSPTRCASDPSALCLGTVTMGSFAAPPTAPPSTTSVVSTLSSAMVSGSAVSNLKVTTAKVTPTPLETISPCADNQSFLCDGTVTIGAFAGAPTTTSTSRHVVILTGTPSSTPLISPKPTQNTLGSAAASTVTALESDSASDSSVPLDTPVPSQLLTTSTIQSTTTLPPSTTTSISVVTAAPKSGPSLQNSGSMSKRPSVAFLLIFMLFALCSTVMAEWPTKSYPPQETFCTEDPLHGCVNGTPMSILTLKATPTTSNPANQASVTIIPCSQDSVDGCVGTTPLSDFWSSTRLITLPPLSTTPVWSWPWNSTHSGNPGSLSVFLSRVSTGITHSISGSTTGSATITPTPCSGDQAMLCVGTVTVGPTPCAGATSVVCVGTVTLATKSLLTLEDSSTTQPQTTSTEPPTGASTSPSVSTSVKSSVSTASATSAGLSVKPPRVFLLVSALLNLLPSFANAASVSNPQVTSIPIQDAAPPKLTPSGTIAAIAPIDNTHEYTTSLKIVTKTDSYVLTDSTTSISSTFTSTYTDVYILPVSPVTDSTHPSYSSYVSPTYWSSTTTPYPTTTSTSSVTSSTTSSKSVGPSPTSGGNIGAMACVGSPFALLVLLWIALA